MVHEMQYVSENIKHLMYKRTQVGLGFMRCSVFQKTLSLQCIKELRLD